MKGSHLSEKIKEVADAAGIDVIGFAEASEFSNYAVKHSKRRSPRLFLPSVKSIIVAGIYIGGVKLPAWTNPWYRRTSRLYLSGFFLDVLRPLDPIASLLIEKGYQAVVCNGAEEGGSVLPLKLAAVQAGMDSWDYGP